MQPTNLRFRSFPNAILKADNRFCDLQHGFANAADGNEDEELKQPSDEHLGKTSPQEVKIYQANQEGQQPQASDHLSVEQQLIRDSDSRRRISPIFS